MATEQDARGSFAWDEDGAHEAWPDGSDPLEPSEIEASEVDEAPGAKELITEDVRAALLQANNNRSRLRGLSVVQLRAIEMLLDGCSNVTQLASALSLHRSTVSRWLHHDPLFIATLNQRLQERQDGQALRIQSTLNKAHGVIAERIADGDAAIAIKYMGLFAATPAAIQRGPVTVAGVEHDLLLVAGSRDERLRALPASAQERMRESRLLRSVVFDRWERLVESAFEEMAKLTLPEAPDHEELIDVAMAISGALSYMTEALELSEGEGLRALDSRRQSDQEGSLAHVRRLLTRADEHLFEPETYEDVWRGDEPYVAMLKDLIAALREMNVAVAGANWSTVDHRYQPLERVTSMIGASDEAALEASGLVDDVSTQLEQGEVIEAVGYREVLHVLRIGALGFARAMLNSMRDQGDIFDEPSAR